MEGFLIRGWEIVVPGWRWIYFQATANQRSAGGVGISTPVRGGFDPEDHRFRPQVVGVIDVWRDY